RIVSLGNIRIDTDRAYVERKGVELTLSALEYRLLLLFATNPGKLVSRDMIRDALWDSAGTYIEENTLSVYIKRLRDKIEDDPSRPELIQTVRGLGYKAMG
ncbi:MAG: response regulator transcription factor, partial [Collinsella intestinalis]|nr:response regulator transcription factor [Collinsella intestinalis]